MSDTAPKSHRVYATRSLKTMMFHELRNEYAAFLLDMHERG